MHAAEAALKDAREQVALDASTTYIEMDTVERELDAARALLHAAPSDELLNAAFTADAVQYQIAFSTAHQSFGGSAQLTTNVPEPSTWAMLIAGFALMTGIGLSRRKKDRFATL